VNLDELVSDSHDRSRRKGWWDDQLDNGSQTLDPAKVAKTIPEKIALIHSEASEVLEEYRNGHLCETYYNAGSLKPEGVPVELADIIIRVADLAGALGINLGLAVSLKARYNETRPHRHGGKTC
jgi:NTP pyrophosphatase (non-canonical NTP hydrolase)